MLSTLILIAISLVILCVCSIILTLTYKLIRSILNR